MRIWRTWTQHRVKMGTRLTLKTHLVWFGVMVGLCLSLGSPTSQAQAGGKILAWIGDGAASDTKTNGTAGQVAYLNTDGTQENLLEVPSTATGVSACGDGATSPDGRRFTFIVTVPAAGRDGGTLYQVVDTGQPAQIGNAHALSCAGSGTFQYSPNSQRLAYIDYTQIVENQFSAGTLNIHNADSREKLVSIENVGAFYLTNDAAFFTRYYTTETTQAPQVDEIAVMVWENNAVAEIATLFADAECRYSSSAIAQAGDRLVVVVGHRCPNAGTTWQLYTLNRNGSNLTLALSDTQAGGFFPNTRTNNLLVSTDNKSAIFTTADGITRSTTGVFSSGLESPAVTRLVERGAVMPLYTQLKYVLPETANPIFTLNRQKWAFVSTESSPVLYVLDLNNLAAGAVSSTATQGGAISGMWFAPTADGSNVYYVMGGRDGDDNTLAKFDLSSRTSSTITTGTFGTGVISSDGSTLAINIWKTFTRSNGRVVNYADLALVNTGDGAVLKDIFIGYDDAANETQFAYPLAYRK